jgi:hypothetical protein
MNLDRAVIADDGKLDALAAFPALLDHDGDGATGKNIHYLSDSPASFEAIAELVGFSTRPRAHPASLG